MANNTTLVYAAIFICFVSVAPRVIIIPKVDFNDSDYPAPSGMTSSAIVAVQISAHSVIPLLELAFHFALDAVLLEVVRPDHEYAARLKRAALVISFHCFVLANQFLNFARMLPLHLLSFISVFQGFMVFITLSSFFYHFHLLR